MSAPSAEHAKAHAAEAANAAHSKPGGHPPEAAGVDGSLFSLLSKIRDDIGHFVDIPAHVYHEQHHHAAGAAEGDHDKPHHPKTDHPKTDPHKKEGAAAPAAEGGDHPKPHHEGEHKTGDHKDDHDKTRERLGDAAPLATALPEAIEAYMAGNITTEHIKHLLYPLVDLANVHPLLSYTVPWVAEGAKRLLNWGLDAHEPIHGGENPVFEKLGKQIWAFDQDKDGGKYHHACEAFVHGFKKEQNIDALNLHFRYFQTKTAFDKAATSDKANLQKQIASLIGVEGTLDEAQARNYLTTVITRLGAEITGTAPHEHVHVHHPLLPALRTKHEALLKLYENALNWLKDADLKKIFDNKVPEKDFTIDFEKFGDLLRDEVNQRNRDRYLRPIDETTFKTTFSGKFFYLTSPTMLKKGMKKPAEMEKILAQLKRFLGLEELPPMDLAAFKDQIKVLRVKVTGDPATIPAAPLDAKYNAFVESLQLVEDAFTQADVLGELFGDEKPQENPIDYGNIGQEVFKRTRTEADLKSFERDFDKNDEMLGLYSCLLTEEKMLEEAALDLDGLKSTLAKLFGINGIPTYRKIADQKNRLVTTLKKLTVTETPKAFQFANVIESIEKMVRVNHILTPSINYATIGADILGRVRTAADLEAVNGVMNIVQIQEAVGSLSNKQLLEDEIEADVQGTQAKIRNLFGITGAVTPNAILTQLAKLETALTLTTGVYNSNQLLKTMRLAAKLLTGVGKASLILGVNVVSADPKALAKLFGTKEVKEESSFKWTEEKYKNFGTTVITTVNAKNQAEAMKGFDGDIFDATFNLLIPTLKIALLGTPEGAKRIKNQLIALFKVEEPFDKSDLDRQANLIRKRLGIISANPATDPLDERLQSILSALNKDTLDKFFEDVSFVGPDNFVERFRDLQDREEVAAFIRGYQSSNFRGHFSYLVDAVEMEEVICSGSSDEKKEAQDQAREFVRQNGGKVRLTTLQTVLKEFEDQITLVPVKNLSAPYQPRHVALLKDLADIKETLETKGLLDRLFNGEKINPIEPKLDQLGMQIFNLSEKELEAYLEKISDMGPDMMTHFNAIKDLTLKSPGRTIGKAEATRIKKALSELLGVQLKTVLTYPDIKALAQAMYGKLQATSSSGQFQKNQKTIVGAQLILNNLSAATNNLDDSVLGQVYKA